MTDEELRRRLEAIEHAVLDIQEKCRAMRKNLTIVWAMVILILIRGC